MKLNFVMASETQMFCEKKVFSWTAEGAENAEEQEERKDKSIAKLALVV